MKALKILFFAMVVFAACKKHEPAQLVVWINKQTHDSLKYLTPLTPIQSLWFTLYLQSNHTSNNYKKVDLDGFYTDNPVPGASNVITFNIDIKETTVYYVEAYYINPIYGTDVYMTKTPSYWDIKIEPGKIHYFQVR